MAINDRLSPLPRSLWLIIGLVMVIGLLAAAGCHWFIEEKLQERNSQYGQALANLAARRALDSTINRDLVSLQVILQDIADNAPVTNATIHDVENNLLVQAGDRGAVDSRTKRLTFTAPITVQDSVAGYVTVTMDLSDAKGVMKALWLITLAATALIIAVLIGGWHWLGGGRGDRAALPIVEEPPAEQLQSAGGGGDRVSQPGVEMIIRFHNLRNLHGQLNHQSLRSICQRLEMQLRDTMALYGGQLLVIDADHARIVFQGAGDQDAFHAACSAHLITHLNQRPGGIQLQLSCLLVHRNDTTAQLKSLPYNLFNTQQWLEVLSRMQNNTILLEAELCERYPELDSRLEHEPHPRAEELHQVTGMREPYRSLLDNQLAQLGDR